MIRRAALLGLLLSALACGGKDESAGTPSAAPPAVPAPPPEAEAGGFRLEVTGTGTPASPPPASFVGDPEGVGLVVRRPAEPEPLLAALRDPSAAPVGGGEEIWRGPARARPGAGLPALPAGLYLVEARRGGKTERTPLVVADLRVLVRRSRREMLVFVADAATGRPIPAADLLVLGRDLRAAGATDATGVWRTALDPGADATVFAAANASVGLAPAGPVTTMPAPPAAVLLTDRTAAAPGDVIRFAAVLRDREDGADAVRLLDGTGTPVAAADAEAPAPAGRVGAIRVPRGIAPGPGELRLCRPSGPAAVPVEILSDAAPAVRVAVDAPARAARGEDVPVRIRAAWAGGLPAAGATVRYRVVRETPGSVRPPEPSLKGEGRLDGEGRLETGFRPDAPGSWNVEGILLDAAAGEVPFATRVEVAGAAFDLVLEPVRGFVEAGEEVRLRAGRRDGGPVAGVVRLGEETRDFAVPEGEDRAEVVFPAPPPGPARFAATATDAAGRAATAEATVFIRGGDAPPAELGVIPERRSIEAGGTARFLVLVPFELSSAARLELVEGTELGTHAVAPTDGTASVVEFPLPAAAGDRIRFLVALVRDGTVHRAAAEIRVAGRGPGPGPAIEAPAAVDAGGEVALRLLLRNAEGIPVAGRAAVSVVAGDGSPLLFEPRAEVPAAGLPLDLTAPGDAEAIRVRAVVGGREIRAVETRIAVRPAARTTISAPARLVAGDVAVVRVSAANPGPDARTATLGVEATNLLAMGRAEASGLIAPGGRIDLPVTVSAARAGPARIRARDGGTAAEVTIPVLPRGSPAVATAASAAAEGRSLAFLDLPADAAAREAPLVVRLSSSPAAAVFLALPELAGAPGDAEELLAVVRPAVELSRRFRDGGIERPPGLVAALADARSALVRLAAFANADGGFGGGAAGSDPGATGRVLLALADLPGDLPAPDPELVRRAVAFLRACLADGLAERDPDAAAAAVRALAERGVDPGPAPDALAEGADRLPPGARADLAMALLALDRRVRAAAVLDGLEAAAKTDARGHSYWGEDGDPVLATAAVVRALLAAPAEGRGELARRGVRFLLDARRGAGWDSPRRTGAAGLALLAAARDSGPPPDAEIGCRIRVGPAIAESFRVGSRELFLTGRAVEIPAGFLVPGRNRLTFELSGGGLDVSARADAVIPREDFPPESRGLAVTRRLVRIDAGPVLRPLEGAVPRGTALAATVRVKSEAAARRVRVVLPLPAGAVPVEGDPGAIDASLAAPPGTRMEIEEGRAVFFLSELPAGETRLAVLLRAAWSGKYAALPAAAAAADEPEFGGRSAAETLYVE